MWQRGNGGVHDNNFTPIIIKLDIFVILFLPNLRNFSTSQIKTDILFVHMCHVCVYNLVKISQRSRSMTSKTCKTPMRQQLENVSTKCVMHNIPTTFDWSNVPNHQMDVSMTTIVYLDFASFVPHTSFF